MKNLILLSFLASIILISCQQRKSNEFIINGKAKGIVNGKVYASQRINKAITIVDSALITNSTFTIKGTIDLPELYYFSINDKEGYFSAFIEHNELTMVLLSDSIKGSTLEGSVTNDLYKDYKKTAIEFENEMRNLYYQYKDAEKEMNKELLAKIDTAYEEITAKKSNFLKKYISDNNNSIIAPYLILRELIYYLDLEELEEKVNNLDISIGESTYTKKLYDRIKILRNVAIGKTAPDINLADTNGNNIALSSLKGNIVLIDFWASWCKPCRVENPNVVKLYKKYHTLGFDVYSVSLDAKKEQWTKAIIDDKLTWNHVSELKGWTSSAASLYGVNSIPHTVLLDNNGVIIAKNLRGEALEKKLDEFFK